MKLVFVSNYLNHHQIPFCNAMQELLQEEFVFIQTEPMEAERVQMGWQKVDGFSYLKLYYEEPETCQRLIEEAEVVLFGGTDEESYIQNRLRERKPIVRYSERLYKTGQWKAVSPRGLRKKYLDHTRYSKAPVYLLCSGAYVPSDFHIVKAYTKKMFCWGYFPETKHYDVDKLLAEKGYRKNGEKIPYLLWAGRFIDWKHPELPLKTACYLKEKGLSFHMDIVGGGDMAEVMKELLHRLQLEDCVTLVGYQKPDEVRERMEKADIYLFTSDRQEGWGAVANEAMNSGCAVIANHMIGAVPYLVRNGQNGYLYQDGQEHMLFNLAEKLVQDSALCREIGRRAYETITGVWNAENAAKSLLKLINDVVLKETCTGKASRSMEDLYPCAPAPVIAERKMWRKIICRKRPPY
uniref:glycosyltransferase family 4 protein n=1 Tax=Acetatifactor sp. TaxID=1872090 RepID=UPI004057B9DE